MKISDIEILIMGLTYVQMELQRQRRDHNGNVLKYDDINELQKSIEILKNIQKDLWTKNKKMTIKVAKRKVKAKNHLRQYKQDRISRSRKLSKQQHENSKKLPKQSI